MHGILFFKDITLNLDFIFNIIIVYVQGLNYKICLLNIFLIMFSKIIYNIKTKYIKMVYNDLFKIDLYLILKS